MRSALLFALLLLAGCGRPEVHGGGPSFPVPWVEDDVTEGGRPDGGALTPPSPDAGTPDGGEPPTLSTEQR